MKNKRCLGFLVITLVLVVSMFSNVFASNNTGWTCTAESGTRYSVGDTISHVSGIYFWNVYPKNASATFESSFAVKSGDTVELCLNAYLSDNVDNKDIDGAASICLAQLISENGSLLSDVRFELSGSKYSDSKSQTIKITNATAGKLKLYLFAEGTGKSGVEARIAGPYVKVNGVEV